MTVNSPRVADTLQNSEASLLSLEKLSDAKEENNTNNSSSPRKRRLRGTQAVSKIQVSPSPASFVATTNPHQERLTRAPCGYQQTCAATGRRTRSSPRRSQIPRRIHRNQPQPATVSSTSPAWQASLKSRAAQVDAEVLNPLGFAFRQIAGPHFLPSSPPPPPPFPSSLPHTHPY